MRRISTVVAAIALVLAACTASDTRAPTSKAPAPATTTTGVQATAPSHIPRWITVKYRATPVDVADPRFTNLGFTDSSLVDAAFYDAANRYMIAVLNGTAYHYCGVPPAVW